MKWSPATKNEVLVAVENGWHGIEPSARTELKKVLMEPTQFDIDRFGKREQVFAVASAGNFVVYFDDIEETFGTAKKKGDLLVEQSDFGELVVALRELVLVSNLQQ